MLNQNLSFRPDLQGVRALAILLVVVAHADFAIAPGGFVGVDVFFVLSGYLITGLLYSELQQNGRIGFVRFYARRLKRLLPALICMLIVSSGLAICLLSGVEARAQLASTPFAVTWTSNLFFAFTAFDYFDELASRDLFLHTWSLGVEEQFYLIWPVLLLMLFRLRKSVRVSSEKSASFMLFGLGVVSILSLSLSVYWTEHKLQAAFYLMPSRVWQLSLGALVYLVCTARAFPASKPLKIENYSTWIYFLFGTGLTLIIGSAVGLSSALPYPGFWALLPSLGAALLISTGSFFPTDRQNPLAHPILLWIGDRSYSLYLWHWPFLVLGHSLGYQGQILPTLILILLSFLAAILSYRLIELPFWKGRLSRAEPKRIILVSLLIMAAVVLGFYYGLRHLPQQSDNTNVSFQWRGDVPDIYRMPCDAWYAHARVEPCVFGIEDAAKTVVILGDSIGLQWFSMVPAIFTEPNWRTVVLTKSACVMADEDYFYPRLGKIYQVCTDWRNAVLDQLDKLKPNVLIMGSASTYGFDETQWIEGSVRVFERLSKAAKTVFVIPGTPRLNFDGPGCIDRNLSPDGSIKRDACLAMNRMQHVETVTEYLHQATKRFPNVHLLDLNDLVCPNGHCSALSEEGIVVFRDSRHLTDSFVKSLIPIIRERFRRFSILE